MSQVLKNNDEAPTILVVKYRALGDSVMGLSTISYLRSIYPNSKIYYGVRSWTKTLYDKVETQADKVIPLSFENLSDFFTSYKQLKKLKIDHIHELHQSGRSKKFFKLFSFLNGVKYTYHNHHLKDGTEVKDQGVIKSLIQRDLDGAYSFLGKENEIPNFLDYVPSVNFKKDTLRRVILGVVATRKTKMWDLRNYVLLANKIKTDFPEITISVPLSKSSTDNEIKKELRELDSLGVLEIVHINLEDIPKYIGDSLLYIGNDTGLKHIAISTDVKSYTFFGPEPPSEWHPYDKEAHPYFFIDPLECRYVNAHYCGLETCESMICLKNIEVDEVYKEIKRDLNIED